MKVKLSAKADAPEKPNYPYLGIFPDGEIVLFSSQYTGVSVDGGNHTIGHYSTIWSESRVKPYTGSVTLKND